MAGRRTPQVRETAAPAEAVESAAPMQHGDSLGFVLQAIYDLNKTVGALNAKVDRLVTDVASVEKKVEDSEAKLVFVKGGITVAGVLLVAGFGFLWWLIGDRVADLKDHLLAQPSPQAADTAKPNSKK